MQFLASFLLITIAMTFSVQAADKIKLKGIKGKDDRVLIENYKYPWSAIGRLNNELGGHCTATLVAPKIVLTAAHCLWNKKRKVWYKPHTIHFLPGYRRGSYIEHSVGTKFHISPKYKPGKMRKVADKAHDWAFIELKTDISKKTGYIGMDFIDRNSFEVLNIKKTAFIQAGYSQDKKHILSVNQSCKMKRYVAKSNIIIHECDAVPGDSGSPLFYNKGKVPRVAAIHVATAYSKKKNIKSEGVAVATSLIASHLKKIGLWKKVQTSQRPIN